MPRSLTLFTAFDAKIRVHISWPIAAAFITTAFALAVLPDRHPDWPTPQLWLTGALIALTLAASVLTHELAHVAVGRRFDMTATTITLFIFGGISAMQNDATRPRAELLVSIAGPITSLTIGLLAILLYAATQPPGAILDPPAADATILQAILYYIALANIILGIFNLVPAFPLDGGRILSATLWAITGNRARAIRIAALIGQLGASAMIAYGAYQFIFGSALSGFWLIALGVFLMEAAVNRRQPIPPY